MRHRILKPCPKRVQQACRKMDANADEYRNPLVDQENLFLTREPLQYRRLDDISGFPLRPIRISAVLNQLRK